jgi:uncharacterized membrane protein required for colicin V production
MIPIIIDVVLVIIMASFIYFGIQKGFILSISGIIILVASFYGAGIIANTYSERFRPMIEPIVSKYVDKSVSETKKEQTSAQAASNAKDPLGTLGLESLKNMGLFSETAQKLVDELKDKVTTIGQDFTSLVSKRITASVSYILTFAAACILITILLTIVLRVLDAAFKLPGLGFINGTGGFLLGFIKGMLVLFAIAWAMRYFGGVFPDEAADKTVILKWLMGNNLLATFFGV